MQHDSATGVCVSVCVLKFVTRLWLLVRMSLCLSHPERQSPKFWSWTHLAEWVRILVCVYVCVCQGWGCCHFGNATAHIAAITTAEKCFSATCNYYRLQIAVLASEALARKGRNTARLCVWMWMCVCVPLHTNRQRDKERWEMIIAHTKNHNWKKRGSWRIYGTHLD